MATTALQGAHCRGRRQPPGTVTQTGSSRLYPYEEVVAILTASDQWKGAERAEFVNAKFEELEQSFKK